MSTKTTRVKRMAAQDSGPSEAELAMQRRRERIRSETSDEIAEELLELSLIEKQQEEEEIRKLKERLERRKAERAEEEKLLAERRSAEDAERKAAEEEKKRAREEADAKKKAERAKKMAEFEKFKNPPGGRNFVINKKEGGGVDEDDEDSENTERKSKEQLEAEKRAILQQRIQPLEIDGFNESKLGEKAKELHKDIYRLEAEKYDLEKRFKEQQYDMMELAERARQVNKVGVDKIQDRFAGAPQMVQLTSKYERKVDRKTFKEKLAMFSKA